MPRRPLERRVPVAAVTVLVVLLGAPTVPAQVLDTLLGQVDSRTIASTSTASSISC